MRITRLPLVLLLLSARPAHSDLALAVAKEGGVPPHVRATHVVLVRDGTHQVLTLRQDVAGGARDYALVIPVPGAIEPAQVRLTDGGAIDRLEAWTAIHAQESWDAAACPVTGLQNTMQADGVTIQAITNSREWSERLGDTVSMPVAVTLTALTAEQSSAAAAWLRVHGYTVPLDASAVLENHQRRGMNFVIAEVTRSPGGPPQVQQLPAVQIAYETQSNQLLLGCAARMDEGGCEVTVHVLSARGRVDAAGPHAERLPSGSELPEYVREDVAGYARSLVEHTLAKAGEDSWLLEFSDISSAAHGGRTTAMSDGDLRALGFIASERIVLGDQPPNAWITRLYHNRGPWRSVGDLGLLETGDRAEFAPTFHIRHEWRGNTQCEDAAAYLASLPARRQKQAEELAALTGWPIESIRAQMAVREDYHRSDEPAAPWWASALSH